VGILRRMNSTMLLPRNTGMTALFSPAHWQRVQTVLESLDERQALWLSGYLAAAQQTPTTPSPVATQATAQITLAYGSETGNSASVLQSLSRLLREQNIDHRLVSLADLKPRTLTRLDYLLLVCSTHGDGDPPEPAAPFFEALLAEQASKLPRLKYAVLALGDSTYEHFCTAGIALDRRLTELGATRLLDCVLCDVDFQRPAESWVDQVSGLMPRSVDSATLAAPVAAPVGTSTSLPSRTSPVELEVLENLRLSAAERRDAIHHLSLLTEGVDLQLQPGDAVGVLPFNPPELVAAILDAAHLSGDEAVSLDGHAMPLVQALREKLDLTVPGKPLLQLLAEKTKNTDLIRLTDDAKAQREFLRQHSVLDVLRRWPATVDAAALVESLRPLQPRLYDIANWDENGELHLTVQSYWYHHRDQLIPGIASNYLAGIQPGETVRLYPHHNKRFRLPDDPHVPLILVATGTGIAPYRAFIQSFASGRSHQCWLLLRERCFEEDFLYQLDWQAALRDGALHKLTTEFTDAGEPLADALIRELADWVGRGAHLYLCGEKEPLAELEANVRSGADEPWQQLLAEKRLHRNLY
jgi:sulfite reductase (NADPH) flavoprotein alpha-component